MSPTFIVFYDDPNHYIKNLPLLITNDQMDNRRLIIIAAIIIILISVVTIYLALPTRLSLFPILMKIAHATITTLAHLHKAVSVNSLHKTAL